MYCVSIATYIVISSSFTPYVIPCHLLRRANIIQQARPTTPRLENTEHDRDQRDSTRFQPGHSKQEGDSRCWRDILQTPRKIKGYYHTATDCLLIDAWYTVRLPPLFDQKKVRHIIVKCRTTVVVLCIPGSECLSRSCTRTTESADHRFTTSL